MASKSSNLVQAKIARLYDTELPGPSNRSRYEQSSSKNFILEEIEENKEKSRNSSSFKNLMEKRNQESSDIEFGHMENIWSSTEICPTVNKETEYDQQLRQETINYLIENSYRFARKINQGAFTNKEMESIIRNLKIPLRLNTDDNQVTGYFQPIKTDEGFAEENEYIYYESEDAEKNRRLILTYLQRYFMTNPTQFTFSHINRLEKLKHYSTPPSRTILEDLINYIDPYTGQYDYHKYIDVKILLKRVSNAVGRSVTEEELPYILDDLIREKIQKEQQLPWKTKLSTLGVKYDIYDIIVMPAFDPLFFENISEKDIRSTIVGSFQINLFDYDKMDKNTLKLALFINLIKMRDLNFINNIKNIPLLIKLLDVDPEYYIDNYTFYNLIDKFDPNYTIEYSNVHNKYQANLNQKRVLSELYDINIQEERKEKINNVKIYLDEFLASLESGDTWRMRYSLDSLKKLGIKIKLPFDIKKALDFFIMLKKKNINIPQSMRNNKYIPKNYSTNDVDEYIEIFKELLSLTQCRL